MQKFTPEQVQTLRELAETEGKTVRELVSHALKAWGIAVAPSTMHRYVRGSIRAREAAEIERAKQALGSSVVFVMNSLVYRLESLGKRYKALDANTDDAKIDSKMSNNNRDFAMLLKEYSGLLNLTDSAEVPETTEETGEGSKLLESLRSKFSDGSAGQVASPDFEKTELNSDISKKQPN